MTAFATFDRDITREFLFELILHSSRTLYECGISLWDNVPVKIPFQIKSMSHILLLISTVHFLGLILTHVLFTRNEHRNDIQERNILCPNVTLLFLC